MYDHIYSAINLYLTPLQHGFMKKRSTVTNLACFTQYTSEILDARGQVDAIYLDFQKAFDQIDLYVLLEKLRCFGFTEGLCELMSSYLFNRSQFVRYRNHISPAVFPTSGVPQGSNLGPLLFLMFVNDIVDYITCEKLLFADDIKLFSKVANSADSHSIQCSLNQVINWCQLNHLNLNISKCFVVRFTRSASPVHYGYSLGNNVLEDKKLVTDLGVSFDAKLSFSNHVFNLISSCHKAYGFIYRNSRDFTKVETVIALFNAFVRSRMEYAALIWYPIYNVHIDRLEGVLRLFLKYLCFLVDNVYPPEVLICPYYLSYSI